MSSQKIAVAEQCFDDELEAAIRGCGTCARGELETARLLAVGLVPLGEIPASVQERVWRRVQMRVAAGERRHLSWPSLWRQRWAVGALGLLLTLAVAVAAIGPQRVWAQVQRLLGYVPGVGFVDLEQTRILAAPVAVTREGVTLYVQQVIAGRDRTTIVIRSKGLPTGDQSNPVLYTSLYTSLKEQEASTLTLRLPDGQLLTHRSYRFRYGQGTIDFPPLPEGVYRATLALTRLPLVPPGAAPEGWEVPLVLRPATGELVAELFLQPYAPTGAAETHDGVTLRVLQVAQEAEETALHVAIAWEDPRWENSFGIDNYCYLKDDLGHVYGHPVGVGPSSSSLVATNTEMTETEVLVIDAAATVPTLAPMTCEQTLNFHATSPMARQLTLVVDELSFRVPAEASLSLDLGEHPQVGDTWPLDIHLQVAGLPVHVVGARLVEETTGPRETPLRRTALEFDIIPEAAPDGRVLRLLSLYSDAAGFAGSGSRSSGTTGRIRASVYVAEGAALPRGVVRIDMRDALVAVHGPWTVTWLVPGADTSNPTAPVVLHPEASQRHGDLTLRVDEVVLSDRLTHVRLALDDAPEGVTLSGMDSWAAIAPGEGPKLYDDRGRDYGLPNSPSVSWRPGDEPTPDLASLTFAPLQPLARRLTLRLPGVRVAWPGPAAFDVEVPAGVALQSSSDERPWRASAPWAVDISVEVAGCPLRFNQAQLEEVNGTIMLRLTSAPYTPTEKDRWLAGLRLTAIGGPGGRAVDVGSAMSTAGAQSEGQREHVATLLFDVADPATGQVQPGRYHVELAGATVAVRGPWEITWDVAGQ